MKHFHTSRRTFVAVLAIACLTVIGLANHADVSMAISGIAAAVAGANAYEGRAK